MSITISTALGQTGDWSMLSSGLLTAITEVLSKFLYETIKKLSCNLSRFREKRILLILLNFINNLPKNVCRVLDDDDSLSQQESAHIQKMMMQIEQGDYSEFVDWDTVKSS